MPPKKKARTQGAVKGGISAKKELAKRLLEGDGADKNAEQAVSLLEECASRGDAAAMLMLAKCCAFGSGTQQDAKRAEELLSDAAAKGSKEAQALLELVHKWKGLGDIDLSCLKRQTGQQKQCTLIDLSRT